MVPVSQKQCPDARLPQNEREFVRPICRIDVDQHYAGQRTTELQQHPFDAVRSPHSHTIAGSESECSQSGRSSLRLARVIGPAQVDALLAIDDCKPLAEAGGAFEKDVAN